MPATIEKRPGAAGVEGQGREVSAMKWSRTHSIIAASAAAVVGAGAALFAKRKWGGGEDEVKAVATARGKTAPGPVGQSGAARSAGPDAMRDPPREWGSVDQASDESFPASDPPPVGSRVD